MMNERRQTTVTFSADTWRVLTEAASKSHKTIAEITREIVEIYLDKWLQVHEASHQARIEALKRQGIKAEPPPVAQRRKRERTSG